MSLDLNKARKCLADFDFQKLFVKELGWDRHVQQIDMALDGQVFVLTAVAHKRGMVAFLCEGKPPDYSTRRKIERQVAKNVHEHLLIFTDLQRTSQIWQWVKREPSKPLACREYTYHHGQPGDSLIQKLQALAFTIEDEENLTIVDVTGRVRAGFDIEPLPDIDFNIRAGNTLVGYATYDEVKRAVTGKLDFDNAMAKIEDKAATLDSAFEMFRKQQTELGGEVTAADKHELRKRLEALGAGARCIIGFTKREPTVGISIHPTLHSYRYQRQLQEDCRFSRNLQSE